MNICSLKMGISARCAHELWGTDSFTTDRTRCESIASDSSQLAAQSAVTLRIGAIRAPRTRNRREWLGRSNRRETKGALAPVLEKIMDRDLAGRVRARLAVP